MATSEASSLTLSKAIQAQALAILDIQPALQFLPSLHTRNGRWSLAIGSLGSISSMRTYCLIDELNMIVTDLVVF